jgi:diguanylate cyclase
MAALKAPAPGGFVVESAQTAAAFMTTDHRPATPIASADAKVQQRRRVVALGAAAVAAVGLGALLGHGLGQSVATSLPVAWQAATPALVGAAVAAMLVPLAAWAAIRIVAPTLAPRRALAAAGGSAGSGSGAVVTPLRAAAAAATVRPASRDATLAGSGVATQAASQSATQAAAQASAAAVDAQAPARDALTGAYTQQHFVAAADREWSRIRRHGEDAALLMIDVDHFKRLNDERGTACGDAMLVEITRLASTTLRPYDLLARFSGGVLVVYLPHTDPLGALDVAERIRERVAGLALLWQGARVRATVSVGVAGIGASHAGLDSVIADAGMALREAKSAGRNCVRSAPIPPKRDPAPARSAG